MKSTIHRTTRPLLFGAALLLALGGCAQEGFESSDLQQTRHSLQTTLERDVRPAVTRTHPEPLEVREATRRFYRGRGYAPAWADENGLVAGVGELMTALEEARGRGLAAHSTAELSAMIEVLESARERGEPMAGPLARLDLQLTRSYLRLASELIDGRVEPETARIAWYTHPRKIDAVTRLDAALAADRVGNSLIELDPPHEGYRQLLKGLASYHDIARAGGWPQVPADDDGSALEKGDEGEAVRLLAHRLAVTGDLRVRNVDPESLPSSYDGTIEIAVRRFQARHGLPTDGVVGAETLAALNVPVEERLRQMEANVERWRWLPADLGSRHILVNVPAYELQVIEHGESVQHMRVVVGRQVSQTPVFSDSIQYVVLNPSWNVPESLALREEFPKVAADPGYLERNGFELVRGFEEEVETVDPYSVDWNDPQAFEGLRLRQRPGADNALGQVKLMFPNEFNVYLHDTPATQAFEQTDRDLSHGCVRVEKPLDLAAYVLGRELADIEAEVGSGATRTVRLDEPLPVHILYWTAWVDDRGRVQFRDDVYSVDRRVIEALGEDTEPRVQIASLES